MIFIEFYNDVRSKFINIGLPTYGIVGFFIEIGADSMAR